jgi:hypothetical protein
MPLLFWLPMILFGGAFGLTGPRMPKNDDPES